MSLSNELISQFTKITIEKPQTSQESIMLGTIASDFDSGTLWLVLDGSDRMTPVSTDLSTVSYKVGDRVMALIKNHSVTIIGNVTSKPLGDGVVQPMGVKITELERAVAKSVTTEQLAAVVASVDHLHADNVTINGELDAAEGYITELQADNAEINERLTAHEADISHLETEKLDAKIAEAEYAKIDDLEAVEADIYDLEATHAEFEQTTTEKLEAADASIKDLDTKKLSSEQAAITYANIDFSNIGKAAMEYFYAVSGLIENVIVGDGTITGRLVGVTISGDILEGNTVIADKLVIKGSDGLYYKLNTDGVTTEAEQTDYNSLNGQVIKAKSVTAEKVNVSDLVAFDATIGGFNITDSTIYSEVKDDEGNTTRGIYMDADGQFNFGDETNFVKYYRDEDGTYRLAISAESILYSLNGKQYSLADLGMIGDYVKIGTYESEPCILLGESDSDFKLVITNTRILFMEGTAVPAYINNKSLHIGKAVVEEELQQGGFVWKVRQNGNMGLVWKGVTN